MNEHMMAAEIAALRNEIEKLKGQIELLGYDIDTYKMTLNAHKEVIERLNEQLVRQIESTAYFKAITAESIAQERAQVVQEVREWAKEAVFTDSWGMPAIYLYQITEKLDSMEPDKEAQ